MALSTFVMDGPHEPVAAPDAADALDRLATLGRTVVLAGDEVAGWRLPEDSDARERWVRAVLGWPVPVHVIPFAAPAWDRHDAAGEAHAQDAWAKVRAEQRAAWLITDGRDDVRPARRAGLRIVHVGPRSTDVPLAAHADIAARDLTDAARLLLAQELFGQIPARRQKEERTMPAGASPKRERQYEHIKESYEERGVSAGEAEERAARTVNKQRAEHGETKASKRRR